MKFDEMNIKMKDGRRCLLRPTVEDDAQDMIDFLKQTSRETVFLLRNEDEVNYTLDNEKLILNSIYESDKALMMVAIVDGKLAGNCSFSPVGYKRRIEHRCTMAIALKKAYYNLGIGSAMIDYMIELARCAGFEQMELEVVDGNDQAIYLYEKKGFQQTGRTRDAMKYDDGTYRDEILMMKKL